MQPRILCYKGWVIWVCLAVTPLRLGANEKTALLIANIDKAVRNADPNASLDLLRKIAVEDAASVASFGRGLGPTTVDRLLLRAVSQLWPKLQLFPNTKQELSDPEWLRNCLSKSTEEAVLLAQLESADPLVRVVALLRAAQSAELSARVRGSLMHIAQHDLFFEITRRSMPSPQGQTQQIGDDEQIVEATLRQMAAKVLESHSTSIPKISLEPSDEEAADWICSLQDSPGINLNDVRFALTLLAPIGPKTTALKKASIEDDTKNLQDLMQHYKLAGGLAAPKEAARPMGANPPANKFNPTASLSRKPTVYAVAIICALIVVLCIILKKRCPNSK